MRHPHPVPIARSGPAEERAGQRSAPPAAVLRTLRRLGPKEPGSGRPDSGRVPVCRAADRHPVAALLPIPTGQRGQRRLSGGRRARERAVARPRRRPVETEPRRLRWRAGWALAGPALTGLCPAASWVGLHPPMPGPPTRLAGPPVRRRSSLLQAGRRMRRPASRRLRCARRGWIAGLGHSFGSMV